MAARVYFSRSAAVSASPVYSGTWDSVAPATRRVLAGVPVTSDTFLSVNGTETSASDYSWLAFQHISTSTLPAQTISGTATAVIQINELNFGANAIPKVRILVCSGDGSVIRGVLGEATGSGPEAGLTASSRIVTIPLSSLVTLAGDRLVVEVGSTHIGDGGTTSMQSTVTIGADSSYVDHAFTDGEAITSPSKRSWIEFDSDIFGHPPTNAAGVAAETLVQSDVVERRAAGVIAETLVQSDNIQRRMAGIAVEVLRTVPRPFVGWGYPVR